jgi:hypothetical protein
VELTDLEEVGGEEDMGEIQGVEMG